MQTISVAALLAVYNWRSDTDRYRRCVRFVEYLFDRFEKLKGPTFQPDWKEMNLAGTIPGWTRFPPAQEMVNKATVARGKHRPGARAHASGPRGAEQSRRAGAAVPAIPGVEQATEAMTGVSTIRSRRRCS